MIEVPHEVRLAIIAIPALYLVVLAVMGGKAEPCDDSTDNSSPENSGERSTG